MSNCTECNKKLEAGETKITYDCVSFMCEPCHEKQIDEQYKESE